MNGISKKTLENLNIKIPFIRSNTLVDDTYSRYVQFIQGTPSEILLQRQIGKTVKQIKTIKTDPKGSMIIEQAYSNMYQLLEYTTTAIFWRDVNNWINWMIV